jgi:arsenate reductase (glutaredoxin)
LTEKGVQFETIDYTKEPLSAVTLKRLLHAAGLGPRDALRTNEAAYKQFVAGKDLDDNELIAVMVAHPELIQRPIVARGDKAVLARPAENLKKLGL